MPDTQACEAEPNSPQGLNCDKAVQSEDELKEQEGQPDVTSSPHMNVIVKEEEEEEPLCGMCILHSKWSCHISY